MAAFYQRAGVPSVDMWMTYDEVNLTLCFCPNHDGEKGASHFCSKKMAICSKFTTAVLEAKLMILYCKENV